jgi:hypothetical protein
MWRRALLELDYFSSAIPDARSEPPPADSGFTEVTFVD